jgi:hypothetical protein
VKLYKNDTSTRVRVARVICGEFRVCLLFGCRARVSETSTVALVVKVSEEGDQLPIERRRGRKSWIGRSGRPGVSSRLSGGCGNSQEFSRGKHFCAKSLLQRLLKLLAGLLPDENGSVIADDQQFVLFPGGEGG